MEALRYEALLTEQRGLEERLCNLRLDNHTNIFLDIGEKLLEWEEA
jgi:hypothetical protein